jgi:hypothetical protein
MELVVKLMVFIDTFIAPKRQRPVDFTDIEARTISGHPEGAPVLPVNKRRRPRDKDRPSLQRDTFIYWNELLPEIHGEIMSWLSLPGGVHDVAY